MEKKKIPMYMKWENNRLLCACSFFSPLCKEYKCGKCEEEVVLYDTCQGVEECMKQRSYIKVSGSIRQR